MRQQSGKFQASLAWPLCRACLEVLVCPAATIPPNQQRDSPDGIDHQGNPTPGGQEPPGRESEARQSRCVDQHHRNPEGQNGHRHPLQQTKAPAEHHTDSQPPQTNPTHQDEQGQDLAIRGHRFLHRQTQAVALVTAAEYPGPGRSSGTAGQEFPSAEAPRSAGRWPGFPTTNGGGPRGPGHNRVAQVLEEFVAFHTGRLTSS